MIRLSEPAAVKYYRHELYKMGPGCSRSWMQTASSRHTISIRSISAATGRPRRTGRTRLAMVG